LLANYPTIIGYQATVSLNGILYSFGGAATTDVSASYRYDPAANAWTAIASLPGVRASASAVTDGTYIYIVGGLIGGNPTNTVYRYDPIANSYTTMAAIPVASGYPVVAYLSGKIYHIGGCPGNCSSGTPRVDVYTLATNTWGSGPPYPIPVAMASVVVSSGFIYVAGGADQTGQATSRTYRLDPTTNVWDDASIADLPVARREAAGDMLNGRWILGGVATRATLGREP
jgi:N-acetylneuraminic acid mutarotase